MHQPQDDISSSQRTRTPSRKCHAAEYRKEIRSSSRKINHTGSVQLQSWLINTVYHLLIWLWRKSRPKTFHKKMSLFARKWKRDFIVIWMVTHDDPIWHRDKKEFENGLLGHKQNHYSIEIANLCVLFRLLNHCIIYQSKNCDVRKNSMNVEVPEHSPKLALF